MMRSVPKDSKLLLNKYAKVDPEIAPLVNIVDVTLSEEVDVAMLQQFINLLFEAGEIPEAIEASRLVAPTSSTAKVGN